MILDTVGAVNPAACLVPARVMEHPHRVKINMSYIILIYSLREDGSDSKEKSHLQKKTSIVFIPLTLLRHSRADICLHW